MDFVGFGLFVPKGRPNSELAFLHDLPVELMWGVGPPSLVGLKMILVAWRE
jgi:hypothetical protein